LIFCAPACGTPPSADTALQESFGNHPSDPGEGGTSKPPVRGGGEAPGEGPDEAEGAEVGDELAPPTSPGRYDGAPLSPTGRSTECAELNATCLPTTPHVCDFFEVGNEPRPVDIVFIVDQSGSMDESIQAIQAELNDFAAYITTLSVDYHVVVVAGLSSSNKLCIPEPLGGPNCGDGERFHAVDVQIGSHSALQQTQNHIDDIESFFREDSLRHFVVVTDDKSKVVDGPGLHQFLSDRPGYEDYLFHGIIGFEQSWCTEEEGTDYVWLADATGGLLFDLCFAEWNWLFTQLGEELSSTITQFGLSDDPFPNSIEVFQDGDKLPFNDGWFYDNGLNLVELTGLTPPHGTAIEVCYVPAPEEALEP